ncbi:hypothetical protein MUP05_06545 [Candidatus Bathyarchaeota archaeon]|nr:hypothetical protein [Candidatus Bathyarchaeota archaeon]
MSFQISKDLKLPRDAATWVLAFLAKRGAGKTYCSSVLAEEMLKAKIPIVVVDGMGIWWGLRVGKNGEGPGLPIVVFGGEHADLPLVPEKAKSIARAIVQANISAVIDLSTLSKLQSRRIVMDFLDELYQINRVERHVFIEETDLWAPQRTIGPEQAQCLGAVDNFVRRGGNHNLGCSMITQRSAVLNKDILTQSDCLVVLRTLAPQDKKAIQAWVEEQTDEDRRKLNQWYDSLKELKNGESWIWHPEKPAIYKKIMFRERETFHATRTFLLSPRASTIKLMDVNEFIDKFRNVFEPKPPPQTVKPSVPAIRANQPISTYIPRNTLTHTPASMPGGNIPKIIPQDSDTAKVQQVVPNLILEKLRPTAQLPADLLENPPTPLARVLVAVTNHEGRDDRWTGAKIKTSIREHAWPDDGVDEAIAELTRWEILRKQSNNYLRFYRDRVQVVDRPYEVAVS